MLGKLLKHEFKANAKSYVPIIIIFLALAVMLRIMSIFIGDDLSSAFDVSYMFLALIFYGGLYVLCIYAFSGSVSRFKKNLFTDEGYLMHTLPVPSYYHILTKLISGIIWLIIFTATAAVCIMIAFLGIEYVIDIASDTLEIITTAFTEYPLDSLLVVILLIAIYSAFILLCYTGTALSSFSHKSKKVISVLIIIAAFILNNFLMYFVSEIIDNINASLEVGLIIYILYFGLIAVGLFFAVNTIMSRHLNLE